MISLEPLIIRNFLSEVRKADHPKEFLARSSVAKNCITNPYSINAQVMLILDTADPKSPGADSGS